MNKVRRLGKPFAIAIVLSAIYYVSVRSVALIVALQPWSQWQADQLNARSVTDKASKAKLFAGPSFWDIGLPTSAWAWGALLAVAALASGCIVTGAIMLLFPRSRKRLFRFLVGVFKVAMSEVLERFLASRQGSIHVVQRYDPVHGVEASELCLGGNSCTHLPVGWPALNSNKNGQMAVQHS